MHPGGALFLMAALVAASLLLRSFWERRQLRVEHYRIPAALQTPCRIVFLSDLHSEQFGADNARLIQAVRALSPDLLLIGGDMITCGRKTSRPPRTGICVHLLEALSHEAPIIYAEGNHEVRFGTRFPENYAMFVQHLDQIPGLTYLHNAAVTMEAEQKGWHKAAKKSAGKAVAQQSALQASAAKEGSSESAPRKQITCFGVSVEQAYYDALPPGLGRKKPMPASYLAEKLGKTAGRGQVGTDAVQKAQRNGVAASAGAYRILLLHSPLYLKEVAAFGADLVLSGHFHGGTIRLPLLGGLMTPQYQFFVKECSGLFQEGETKMIVSRGLGTHSIRIRLNDLPEISCIDLAADAR